MSRKASHPLKIVTCCYCGARSTLGHAPATRLVCHGCGAAITKIEPLQPERKCKGAGPKPAIPHPAETPGQHLDKDRPSRRKKGKRRKGKTGRRQRSFWYQVREAFDDLDDVFEIDLFD